MNVDTYPSTALPSPDSVGKGGVIFDGTRLRVSNGDTWSDALNIQTGDTLVIADADALTLAGVKVPQYLPIVYRERVNGNLGDETFFTADRAYQVVSVTEIHATAGNDAGAVNVQVTKDTATDAPGAGTDLLTNNTNAGFDLKGAANTLQTGTLTATTPSLQLAAGNRLSVDFAGVLTTLAGVQITVLLKLI